MKDTSKHYTHKGYKIKGWLELLYDARNCSPWVITYDSILS